MYTCDNWVIIKFKGDDPHYRVLTGTSGSYLSGSYWRMNSGIVKIEEDSDYYLVYGASGSVYRCHKHSYFLRTNNVYVWKQLQEQHGDKVEIVDVDTDWLTFDWIIT